MFLELQPLVIGGEFSLPVPYTKYPHTTIKGKANNLSATLYRRKPSAKRTYRRRGETVGDATANGVVQRPTVWIWVEMA
jgi:hypothetical protein